MLKQSAIEDNKIQMKYLSDELRNKVTISDLKSVKMDLIESTD